MCKMFQTSSENLKYLENLIYLKPLGGSQEELRVGELQKSQKLHIGEKIWEKKKKKENHLIIWIINHHYPNIKCRHRHGK